MRRLFVAGELPQEVRARLAAVAPGPPWRPVPEERLHVTLAFLGARPDAEVPAIAAAMAGAAGGPVAVELGEGVLLPPRRPRVCAVRLVAPELEALQERLVHGLEARGAHTREPRPFLAHVTVARARGRVSEGVPRVSGRFVLGSISLLESTHARGGTRYVVLERTTLGA